MSKHVRAGQVVDSNDLYVPAALGDDSSDTAPNSSEAIDSDFRGHFFDSLVATASSECAVGEGAR
jgi:dUTPase